MEEDIPLDFGKELHSTTAEYFRFHFTGISFTAPKSVRFKYRLSNLDRDGKPRRTVLFFTVLAAGLTNSK